MPVNSSAAFATTDDPRVVRRILTQSARKLGPATDFGAGLVDPVKALELAAPKSATPPHARSAAAASATMRQ
jgi:hypothetical protein